MPLLHQFGTRTKKGFPLCPLCDFFSPFSVCSASSVVPGLSLPARQYPEIRRLQIGGFRDGRVDGVVRTLAADFQ